MHLLIQCFQISFATTTLHIRRESDLSFEFLINSEKFMHVLEIDFSHRLNMNES